MKSSDCVNPNKLESISSLASIPGSFGNSSLVSPTKLGESKHL